MGKRRGGREFVFCARKKKEKLAPMVDIQTERNLIPVSILFLCNHILW